MRLKKVALILIVLTIIPMFSMMFQNVDSAGAVESIEINGVDSPYEYDIVSDIFNLRIYYDTYYGQIVKYKWSDENSYRLWSAYNLDSRVTFIGQDYGSDETGTYRDWDFTVDLTEFTPGSFEFQTYVIDIDATIHLTNASFIRESEPVERNPPTITISSPYDMQYINVSSGAITTKAKITDDFTVLQSAKVYWNGVVNKTFGTFSSGSVLSHTIPILAGVTTNGTHTITWEATDSDYNIMQEEVSVIVFSGEIMIEMLTDIGSWFKDNDFLLHFNFSDPNGLDDARMYIPGCEFDGTNQVITINDAEAFYYYLQNISIDSEHFAHAVTITYSDVMKYFYGFLVDDSGEVYSGEKVAYFTIDGTEFLRRNEFSVTNQKASTLTNFPVRIPITYDSDMQSDFDDVCFTDTNDELYDFEITSVVADSSCQAWIEIPSWSASATITIRMYYGNPTALTKEDVSGTWENYRQVYHFDETSGDASDSSANGNTLTNVGSDMSYSGMVGDGVDLSDNNYLYRTDTVLGGGDDTRTWLWWANIDSDRPDIPGIWSEYMSGSSSTYYWQILEYQASSGWEGWYVYSDGGGTDTYQATNLWNKNEWHFSSIIKNGTAIEYFLSGVSQATDTNGLIYGHTDNDLYVGETPIGGKDFDGTLDELMVYDGILSDDYIYNTYYFQSANRASWIGEENKSTYFYSSEGWTWNESTSDSGSFDGLRADGYWYIWHDSSGDVMEISANKTQLTADGNEYMIEANMTATNTTADYDGWGIATKIDSTKYAIIYYKPHLTDLCYGVSDSSRANWGSWLSDYSYDDFTWNQNEWHTLKIWVSVGNWVAYYIDGVQQANYTSNGILATLNFTMGYISVNNLAGESSKVLKIDYFKSGWEGFIDSNVSETCLSNSLNVTLPISWGEDIQVNHTATLRTRFDAIITIERNSTYHTIFENSLLTETQEVWGISDYHWENNISEGVFYINLYLSNDMGTTFWFNMTMHKDLTAPSFHIRLIPEEDLFDVFLYEMPPCLDFTYLEWGDNEGFQNYVFVNVDDARYFSWADTRYHPPDDFPTSEVPIAEVVGTHFVIVYIGDTAGHIVYQRIDFEIVRRKEITFSFKTSSGDTIPNYIAQTYRIEINSFATDGLTGYTIYDTFTLGIYDGFGQTLYYGASVSYTSNIEVTLSTVHRVTFSNGEAVSVEVTIQKTSGVISFIIAGNSDRNYYLKDGIYIVIADPMGALRTRFTQFVATDYDFAVTSSGTNVLALYLDFIEVDGIQGFSFSSITDMLNLATWMILIAIIVSSVVVLRRLRPPLMRIEDELVPQIPLLPIRITTKKQWHEKGESTIRSSNNSGGIPKGFKEKK